MPKTPYSTITQGEHRTHVHDLADTAQARTAWQRGVGNSPKSKKTQNFFSGGDPQKSDPEKCLKPHILQLLTFSPPQLRLGAPHACDIIALPGRSLLTWAFCGGAEVSKKPRAW